METAPIGSTGLLTWGPRAAPAAPTPTPEHTHFRASVKPIAVHNAEMATHAEQWFPPDEGKTPRVFKYVYALKSYLVTTLNFRPRAGFLNYDGKCEILPNPENAQEHFVLVRRDLSDAEFATIPTIPIAEESPATSALNAAR